MTLYQIKPSFQALLRPLMFWLNRRGVTANHITLCAMVLSLITGVVLIIHPQPGLFVLLPVVLFVRMALNALDGMLARECNQRSRLGAILNETGDVISDISLYLPFMLLPQSSIPLVLIVVFCALMTEFCGVLAQTINGVRSYAGPLGKSDRALVFGAWGCHCRSGRRLSPGIMSYGVSQHCCCYGRFLIAVAAHCVKRV